MNHRAKPALSPVVLDSVASANPRIFTGIYILLGLVLVGSLVGIFIMSSRLADVTTYNSNRVDLAGNQSSRTQRMTKALLAYERDMLDGKDTSASLAEIEETSRTFNNVLKGFDSGAKITGIGGKEMDLKPSTDKEEIRVVKRTKELWLPLYELVKRVASGKATKPELTETVNMARERNIPIFELMDSLTRQSDVTGQAEIKAVSGIRNILIGLASVTFFLIPSIFLIQRGAQQRQRAETALKSLEETYGELSSMGFAKAETDRIMETVQEGLFLINQDGIIGDYHSREAPLILRQESLAGTSLYAILKRHLSEKMFNTSKDFFDLLFDASRKEKTVLSVNPLTDVEVNFPNPAGGFITRYLGFSFRRILVDGKVDRLFVALRDVTKQMELENQLREAEKTKEREMQILLGIVHVPHADLEQFINLATEELGTINSTLRAEDFAASGGRHDVLRGRLETVFRCVHNLNGNAALIKLEYFQKAAHEFESKIKDLLSRKSLTGDDFLSIVVAQAGLRSDLSDLQNLRSKLGNLTPAAPAPAAANTSQVPASALAEQLRQLVETSAIAQEKSARLAVDEFALHAFAHGRTDLIRDVLVQLTRNAVAHGVETPAVREAAGKSPSALLSIHALPAPSPGVLGLAVRDDGRGLDIEGIRKRAIESGLLSADAETSTEEVVQCIFQSGFSTAEEADLHAGRGVGMDIVKSKFVDTAGGCIEVVSEAGQFCEFRLFLPS